MASHCEWMISRLGGEGYTVTEWTVAESGSLEAVGESLTVSTLQEARDCIPTELRRQRVTRARGRMVTEVWS